MALDHELVQQVIQHVGEAGQAGDHGEVHDRDAGRDGQPAVGDAHQVGMPQPGAARREVDVEDAPAFHGRSSVSDG